MRIMLIVPGILATRGDFVPGKGIQRLVPYIVGMGYRAWPIYPGFFGLLRVRLAGGPVAHTFASFVRELSYAGHSVSGVGHSHGARLLAEASRHDAPFETLTFINGAIDKDVRIGRDVGKVINYYVRSDKVLGLAHFLLFNPMGNAGKIGVDFAKVSPAMNGNLFEICGATGHGDYADSPKLERLACAWAVDLQIATNFKAQEAT